MRLSSSIRRLTVLGFLLVVIPLTVALISTVLQVDRLAVQMQKVMQESVKAVEASRLITTQALSMERSAGQYGILRDPVLFERYQTQRKQLSEAITRLSDLPLGVDLPGQLAKLSQREEALYAQLKKWVAMRDNDAQILDSELKLAGIAGPIPGSVTEWIVDNSDAMNLQIERVQQLLLWQAIALVPLALILSGIFSILITRPLRNLGKAIHRLGAGEWATPVSVSGPQDVHELGEQLDGMRQRLAELDQQKLVFLQHVSHELKTPLTAIREGAGLLRDKVVGSLNEEQAEVVEILQESSLQLQTQVEGLLNFNLAMAQDRPTKLQEVDLEGVIHEAIKKHQLAMRPRHIRVVKEIRPVVIPGELEQLRNIIDNLLSNAIKYSPDSAEIKIKLGIEGTMACLDVIDQGAGVSAEYRQQVFEPFFQGKQVIKGPVKGTGLGLAIVQRYVLLHNGSIKVMESDQGAHFRICLPLDKNKKKMGDRMQGLFSTILILLLGALSACAPTHYDKPEVQHEPLQVPHENSKIQPELKGKPAKEVVSECGGMLNYYETLRLMSLTELEQGLITLRQSLNYTKDNCNRLRLAMLLGLPEFRLKNDDEAEQLLKDFLEKGRDLAIQDRQIAWLLSNEIHWRKKMKNLQDLLKKQIEAEQARSLNLLKRLEEAQSKLEQLQNIDKNINAREQEISTPLTDKILHEPK